MLSSVCYKPLFAVTGFLLSVLAAVVMFASSNTAYKKKKTAGGFAETASVVRHGAGVNRLSALGKDFT